MRANIRAFVSVLLVLAILATAPFIAPASANGIPELPRREVYGTIDRSPYTQQLLEQMQEYMDDMLMSVLFAENQLTTEETAAADDREQPECLEEALIKQDVTNWLGSIGPNGYLQPPGTMILDSHQLGDPRYNPALGAADGWKKYQVTAYWGDVAHGATKPPNMVVIHYMFNRITGKFEQVKFKNTPQKGCGTRVG